MTTSEPDPRMAVIGMAFRLPGADTPEEFWRVIHEGTDRVTRFTDEELSAAGVPAEEYRADDFVGASGVLDDIAGFDAQHFAMSAREARLTDPQHRMFLECAQHALENAGYPDERHGSRVGVYASTGYHLYTLQNYLLNNVLPNEPPSDWTAGMQTTVANYTDFTATRVAYRLGLTGPADPPSTSRRAAPVRWSVCRPPHSPCSWATATSPSSAPPPSMCLRSSDTATSRARSSPSPAA